MTISSYLSSFSISNIQSKKLKVPSINYISIDFEASRGADCKRNGSGFDSHSTVIYIGREYEELNFTAQLGVSLH